MFIDVIKEIKIGSKIYIGYCMNALVDCVPMKFNNDEEAINFYSKYEANAYVYDLTDNGLTKREIYNPREMRG